MKTTSHTENQSLVEGTAVSAPPQRDTPRPQNESFACSCGGETIIESTTSILHDCKSQPGCKVFDNPRGFIRRVRVQINPALTGGVEKYNWLTPVAVFVPGQGALCTTTKYSRTTSKHITRTVERWGATRHNVDQAIVDKYAENLVTA